MAQHTDVGDTLIFDFTVLVWLDEVEFCVKKVHVMMLSGEIL